MGNKTSAIDEHHVRFSANFMGKGVELNEKDLSIAAETREALGRQCTLVRMWPHILRSIESAVTEVQRSQNASKLSTAKCGICCSVCWLMVSFFCGIFMTVFGFTRGNPTLGYVGVFFIVEKRSLNLLVTSMISQFLICLRKL